MLSPSSRSATIRAHCHKDQKQNAKRTLTQNHPKCLVIPVGFMFLECAQGFQDEILQQVKKIPGVAYAYKVDKNYDLVIKIESDSIEKFTAAISQIRMLGNLVNTDTMVGFKG